MNEASLLQSIAQTLYTAVLSDVLDELGFREQAMPPSIRPLDDDLVMVGRARTGVYREVYSRALRVARDACERREAAQHLARRRAHGLRVQRVAAHEVDLLELREKTGARFAARDALHLLDGQGFPIVEAIGVELRAAVEVSGDQEHVASHALLARAPQPVGPAALDELDEIVVRGRQRAAQDFALVVGVDGDGAHRATIGVRRRCEHDAGEERDQCAGESAARQAGERHDGRASVEPREYCMSRRRTVARSCNASGLRRYCM